VLDLFAHLVDLFPAGVESHRDDHGLNLSIIFYSSRLKSENLRKKTAQNKKPTLCEWAKSLFAEIV